jgi:nicotinate-nucleotide adenylyltransferase
MPIGVLGGTFDPPHVGHLVLGECARAQLGLERVYFMPAGDPWRKAGSGVSSSAHRLAMTHLAIADNPTFHLDEREVERIGPTYTVDTLRELHAQGMDDVVLILGSDALADMPAWREPDVIAALARLAVAPKDADGGEQAWLAAQVGFDTPPAIVEMPPLPVSSTLVRERVREGMPIRYLVPAAVEEYITTHGLYR